MQITIANHVPEVCMALLPSFFAFHPCMPAQQGRAAIAAEHETLPERVEVVGVPSLARPDVLRGGDGDPGYWTGGFIVPHNYSYQVGISTAAHCGNYQTFHRYPLPFAAEVFYDSADVQWHTACPYTEVTNEFNSGLGYRAVVGIRGRADQSTGSHVCKYGTTTGRTCGYIQTKNYEPSYVPNSDDTRSATATASFSSAMK
jgi:streptogrisin C